MIFWEQTANSIENFHDFNAVAVKPQECYILRDVFLYDVADDL